MLKKKQECKRNSSGRVAGIQYAFFFFFFWGIASAEDISKPMGRDSSLESPVITDSLVLKNEKGIWGEILNFPFEYVIEPVFKVALYPIKKPIDYVNNTHVIDRVADLVQLGPNDNIIIFPALNLLSANGSVVGVRYFHKEFFQTKKTDRLTVKFDRYLDDDWWFSVGYTNSMPWGFSLSHKFSINNYRDVGVSLMSGSRWENEGFYHSDYGYYLSESVSYSINDYLGMSIKGQVNRFDFSGPGYLREAVQDSGMLEVIDSYKLFGKGWYYPVRLSLSANDKENSHAASFGEDWEVGLIRVFSPDLGDYYSLSFNSTNYFLLGDRAYKVSRSEQRERIKKMSRFNFSEILPFLDVKDFEKALFERRIVVQYIGLRQAFKAENQPIMYQGYSQVGRGTPLRGYSGGSFINKGYVAWGLEYRWPIIRQVDGVFFNEYAHVYSKINEIENGNLYNSWGFGIRVRNPDLFFLRMQLAFHGLEGGSIIMTTSSAF